MTASRPLPAPLRHHAFTTAEAARAGVHPHRLDRLGLARPFHGVAVDGPVSSVAARVAAYAPRMQPGWFFTGSTAAVLHRLPIPARLESEPLHVAAIHPAGAPGGRGVIGHRLRATPTIVKVDGAPTVDAVEAWCRCAGDLSRRELLIMGDALLMGDRAVAAGVLAAMPAQIDRIRREGTIRLRTVLPLLRPGVRSPKESELRLLIHDAGLPEPEVNARIIRDDGTYLGEGDLVWRRERVVVEYEGDHHRLDRSTFQYDIRRREAFEDAGWSIVRVVERDLRPESVPGLIARLRLRLTRAAPRVSRSADPNGPGQQDG